MIDVRGWMREDERAMLRRRAFGLSCLEVGSYCGLSTAQIACTANEVLCIDTFDGRGTIHAGPDTEEAFWNTLRGCGTADKVKAIKGLSEKVLPALKPGRFDFIFIDGSHDYESVSTDARLAIPLLAPGGILAFHDYSEGHDGVMRAVDELLDGGAHAVEQCNSLVALSMMPRPEPKPPKVGIALPHRGDSVKVSLGAAVAWMHYATLQGLPLELYNRGSSILTKNFNDLLAEALNGLEDGVTHFAMLHDDIIPCKGWVDILLEEMVRLNVDMVSAVVPLKNGRGLTSTGLVTPGDPWSVRRLTMTEVMDLPETFTAADVPYRMDEGPLLVNSGCFLMKLTEPWVEGMWFRQTDRMAYNTRSRKYVAQSISEDWDFSRQLHTRGGRIAATRKVTVQHERPEFHNREAWGSCATDPDYQQYLKQKAEAEGAPAVEAPEQESDHAVARN